MKFYLTLLTAGLLLCAAIPCAAASALSQADITSITKQVTPKSEPRRTLYPAKEDLKAWEKDPSNTAALERAMLRHRLILEAWEADYKREAASGASPKTGSAHVTASILQSMRNCFFSWYVVFDVYKRLAAHQLVDDNYRARMSVLAKDILRPVEREANNRSFHYALGCIIAAQLFPELPEAKTWRAYAEAVWNDWAGPGDCYEPGYVPHNIRQVLELGVLLGKQEEIKSDKIRQALYRYRDDISPSGLTVSPGDGGNYDQQGYAEALSLAASITKDPTLLWAAQRATLAGTSKTGRVAPSQDKIVLAEKFAAFEKMGLAPQMPDTASSVQNLYPATYKIPNRLILNPSRKPGNPFAAFYLMDRDETTFHAHEDNRGTLYHYEVDGVLYGMVPSLAKWNELANGFVASDAADEFPFRATAGVVPNHWYKGSQNLTLLRHFLPSENWVRTMDASHGIGQYAFKDVKTPLGYSWTNPDGMAGKCEDVRITTVTMRFVNFPRAEVEDRKTTASFDPGLGWYRDYRAVAPADGPVDVLISRLTLAGPKGVKTLAILDKIPKTLQVAYLPANTGKEKLPVRLLTKQEMAKVLRVEKDAASGKPVLRLTCLPGRTDLILPGLDEKVNLTSDYHRIGLDYNYMSGARDYLRPPLRILVNDENSRSFYMDRQQGGVLKNALTQQQGEDCYGEMNYAGIYTHDSLWKRQAVLSREGYLVVRDEFTPGAAADGMVAGPVWQLMNPPTAGDNWFDADAAHPQYGGEKYLERGQKRLLAYFDLRRGQQYGVQYQSKIFGVYGYAVYARAPLAAGHPETFLTVLVPHDASLAPETLGGGVSGNGKSKSGINSTRRADGSYEVTIASTDKAWKAKPVRVTIASDGKWSVKR